MAEIPLSLSRWSQLPHDLFSLLSPLLHVNDIISSDRTCMSWHRAFCKQPSQHDSSLIRITTKSFPSLTASPNRKFVCRLDVLDVRDSFEMSLNHMNILSLTLPHLRTLSCVIDAVWEGEVTDNRSHPLTFPHLLRSLHLTLHISGNSWLPLGTVCQNIADCVHLDELRLFVDPACRCEASPNIPMGKFIQPLVALSSTLTSLHYSFLAGEMRIDTTTITVIRSFTQLRILWLNEGDLYPDELQPLLAEPFPFELVEKFELGMTTLTESGMGKAIGKFVNLREFSMDRIYAAQLQFLGSMTQLRRVNLNCWKTVDISTIIRGLSNCTLLEHLFLSHHDMTHMELHLLLSSFPYLDSLSLERMDQVEELKFLAASKLVNSLTSLTIHKCTSFPFEELQFIFALRNLESLELVHVSNQPNRQKEELAEFDPESAKFQRVKLPKLRSFVANEFPQRDSHATIPLSLRALCSGTSVSDMTSSS